MDNSETANNDNTKIVDNTENSLETDMTDAELEAFVDKTLGITHKAKDDSKSTTDNADDKNASESEDDKSKESKNKTDDKDEAQKAKEAEDNKKAEEEKSKSVESKDKFTVQSPEEPYKPQEIPEVQTDDLWIEIDALVADSEGETKPETIKITYDGEIPENVRFKNDKQLAETLEGIREMKEVLAEREAEREEKLEAEQKKVDTQANQKSTMDAWDAEIADLIEAGLLEAPKAAIGSDEFNSDPAVIKIDEIFKFMTTENEERAKDGKPRLASFGTAFNLFSKKQSESDESKKKAEEEQAKKDKEEAELTKKRGSLVGGGGSGNSGSRGFIYKRGSARSVYDVKTDDI